MSDNTTKSLRENLKHLRSIVEKESLSNVPEEFNEFYNAILNDLGEVDSTLEYRSNRIKELEESESLEAGDFNEYAQNKVELGVDTVYWELDLGNIVVQDKIEQFFNRLKQNPLG